MPSSQHSAMKMVNHHALRTHGSLRVRRLSTRTVSKRVSIMEFDEKETDAHLNHSHGTASPNLANANSIISASGVNGKAQSKFKVIQATSIQSCPRQRTV